MKNIFITQGLYYDKRKNLFTKLDYDWCLYSKKIKFILNPIPYDNNFFYDKKKIDGIVFSGGNDLYCKNKKKENLKRDIFEKKIYNYFINKNIPMMFICRGMQLLANMNNIRILRTFNHVRKNHKIKYKDKVLNVNSYHNYLFYKKPKQYDILGEHLNDNSIEIMHNKEKKIIALMFHPERKSKDQKKVDVIFKKFFDIK